MANEAGLLELVAVIDKAREDGLWSQAMWAINMPNVCGTTCCAAGWKATIDKQEFAFVGNYAATLIDGTYIEDYAAEALDLTDGERVYLFRGTYDNDFEKFSLKVKQVINGEVPKDRYDVWDLQELGQLDY